MARLTEQEQQEVIRFVEAVRHSIICVMEGIIV